MLPTYPEVLPDGPQPNGPAMAAALAAIAATGPGIGDPVEWQRESRTDRALPGRDE